MESELKEMLASLERTGYCQWMKTEGVPIVEGFSIKDVRELKLSPWRRMGGSGAFVHLYGMEGQTGMYVAEIPPGGALNPERHLYEEMICILAGHGATEVWQDGGQKRLFEWGPFSLFAPPLNSWHRLVNGGREPVRLMAVTTAPIAMDFYRNAEFIFNCPYTFTDRFRGEDDYFARAKIFTPSACSRSWETNFVPDAKEVKVRDDLYVKGAEVNGAVRIIEKCAHRPRRRLAQRPLPQGALPRRRRSNSDFEIGGIHVAMAEGKRHSTVRDRPRR
jgi:mannose-6-phosphate isomerase-like protein (cupin superfamily)